MPRASAYAARLLGLLAPAFVHCVLESEGALVPRPTASISVDRKHIYLMEPFTAIITVNSEGARLASDFGFSDLAGKEEIELLGDNWEELTKQRKAVGRAIHTVYRFRRRARATKPGRITLAPIVYGERIDRTRYTVMRSTCAIRAKPLLIQVHQPPQEGRPELFSGAVGRLSFDVEIAPTNLALGDLVTATLSIKGNGYMDEIDPPVLSPGRNFKVYDMKERPREPGARVFEQIIVPQNSNAVEMAAVSFCYFDTDARRYKTITRGPFRLRFHAPEKKEIDKPYEPTRPPQTPPGDRPAAPSIPHSRVTEYRALVSALVFSLICAIAFGGWLILKVRRPGVLGILLIVVGLQGAGLYYVVRHQIMARPLGNLAAATPARLAPSPAAFVTFEIPKGASVQLLESESGWRKVEFKNKRGWVPLATLTETSEVARASSP